MDCYSFSRGRCRAQSFHAALVRTDYIDGEWVRKVYDVLYLGTAANYVGTKVITVREGGKIPPGRYRLDVEGHYNVSWRTLWYYKP